MALALLLLLPLASCSPLKVLSYSALEEGHSHTVEGIPGEAVTGEFSFKAPDTESVFHLTYSADSEGFRPVADHLPVSVVMDPVPELVAPTMVEYTPEVAAARAQFLKVQEEVMAHHAMEEGENMVEHEEVMERRRREASPVIIPSSPVGFYPAAGSSPVGLYPAASPGIGRYLPKWHPSVAVPASYHPYYTVPHALPQLVNQVPVFRQPILPYPYLPLVQQVQKQSAVPAFEQEGEQEPAALAL